MKENNAKSREQMPQRRHIALDATEQQHTYPTPLFSSVNTTFFAFFQEKDTP